MYVDAILDRNNDRIHIVERVDGQRVYKDVPVEYLFYYDDPKGKHQTIYRTPVSRVSTNSLKEFKRELKLHSHKKTWESDINPVFRCLEKNYLGADAPKLNTAFLDIEADFDLTKGGYAPPTDPFNKITAISVYLDWMDKLITLVLPPKSMSFETAEEIANKFEDTILFKDEGAMLDTFLEVIQDADVLSGWNSESYDIPYLVGRVARCLSKNDLRRFCLWEQMPKKRDFERYGAAQVAYDLVGRVHLDYMELYKKYTYEERHSWSLDAICEIELNERKVAYEGSLDQLYNKDFYKFIDYNRQDTALLGKLDVKLKFLDLANQIAHDNTVLLQTTMGAVAVTDQAIINEAHQQGFVVPDRQRNYDDDEVEDYSSYGDDDDDDDEEDTFGSVIADEIVIPKNAAAGAYVAYPKKGMHYFIGGIDINSLYPSTIRALNMGPETIVGQLRPIMTENYIKTKMRSTYTGKRMKKGASFAAAWEGLFGTLEYTAVMEQEVGTEITIDWEHGETTTHSAAEVFKIIFESDQPWVLSANGTIFKYDTAGIIPSLLARWYSERKELQTKKKEATEKADIEFWDKRQLVKKINLNSLYGAILNPGCRFFDQRIGQSTTLCGRTIAKHMDAFINECVTGEYAHDGDSVIYGDTDSCYFSAWPILKKDVKEGKMAWDIDTCIALYDEIANQLNGSFPGMMEKSFNCPRDMGAIIKAGRELVATKGLFIKKKRYAVLIADLEGNRLDLMDEAAAKKKGVIHSHGKVKAMGLDLKRSDTPKVVQDFLMGLLKDVLTMENAKPVVIDKIRAFKEQFSDAEPWQKGTPKRVNNLTSYVSKEERQGKANMPGHVRASMNWNILRRLNSDSYSMQIVDGMKVIVCKLKENPLGYTTVAYPTDLLHVPKWFKELPFDDELMELTIVDKKVENLLGVLSWDLDAQTQIKSTFNQLFDFG